MSEQQREEKTWVEGLFIYEHTFTGGGSVLNCSVDVPRLIAWLNEHKDEAGRVKFKISKKREANKAGTHSAYLDTWKPAASGDGVPSRREERAGVSPSPASGKPDDLPF